MIMKSIWFTSDQHFWHTRVIQYCNRPFDSIEEMNEAIVENYNKLVKPEDLVYHLGDFSMAIKPVEDITPRLNGQKILIAGNHDFCHPSHKKGRKEPTKWLEKYKECGFTEIHLHLDILLDDQWINLSHFPYKDLEDGEHGLKHAQYRLNHSPLHLLHGHVHNSWKTKSNMLNVGVDVWDFKPVHADQILEIIKK